jgi:hypothetical protein
VLYLGRPAASSAFNFYVASTKFPNTEVAIAPMGSAGIAELRVIQSGDRIVFQSDLNTRLVWELYALDTRQPGSAIRLSGPVANIALGPLHPVIAPDEARVVYEKRNTLDSFYELFSAPTDREAGEETLIRVATPRVSLGDYVVTSDSRYVVFTSSARIGENIRRDSLFAVPIEGGVPVRLHTGFTDNGWIEAPQALDDGQTIIYLADSSVRYEPTCAQIVSCQFPPSPTFLARVGIPDLFAATIPSAPGILGDMNGDGTIDAVDLRPFRAGINHPLEFAYSFGLDAVNFGDMNGDGLFDDADIPGFAAALAIDPSTITAQLAEPSADYNGDGAVNAVDYTIWRNTYGERGDSLAADATGNGIVDISDYYVWKAEYGRTATGQGASQQTIPEPAAWSMLLIALLTAVARRRFAGR